jgi:hypothetical protein
MVNGALNVLVSSRVGGGKVYYYLLGFPRYTWEASNYYVDVSFPAAEQAPVLGLSFNPPNPSTQERRRWERESRSLQPAGANGQPFSGTLGCGPQSSDTGDVFGDQRQQPDHQLVWFW